MVACCLGFSHLAQAQECTLRNTAETTTVIDSDVGPGVYIWQEFTACETGPLQSMMFTIDKNDYAANGAIVSIFPASELNTTTILTEVPDGISTDVVLEATTEIATNPFQYGTIDIPSGTGEEILNFIPSVSTAPDLVAGTEYIFEIFMTVENTSIGATVGRLTNQVSTGRNNSGIGFVVEDLATGSVDAGVGNFTTGTSILDDQIFGTIDPPLQSETQASGRAPFAMIFAMVIGAPVVAPAQAPIPTMSEWGLMIFGLLVLNLGIFFVYKRNDLEHI